MYTLILNQQTVNSLANSRYGMFGYKSEQVKAPAQTPTGVYYKVNDQGVHKGNAEMRRLESQMLVSVK